MDGFRELPAIISLANYYATDVTQALQSPGPMHEGCSIHSVRVRLGYTKIVAMLYNILHQITFSFVHRFFDGRPYSMFLKHGWIKESPHDIILQKWVNYIANFIISKSVLLEKNNSQLSWLQKFRLAQLRECSRQSLARVPQKKPVEVNHTQIP